MKYVVQMGIIAGISFAGELLYMLLPLPVPASVYGLLLLFALLMLKVIKLEQIQETADFFLLIMPILFISPSVSLITSMDLMKGNILAIILMTFLSTIVVTIVTGLVSQCIICRKKKRKE
ncbi:MAG: CidA/LrgA family protein [Lachnospiraceae bacterium]|nr:CidA/LrgA family protein [Lachnospiraceae bacterium]